MMMRGKHIIKTYMTLDYDYTGIRMQDGYMTPVSWKLKVNLIAPDKKLQEKSELEYSAGLAYQRLYFWLDTNLPNIIVVDVNDETDLYLANMSSNIMMYCPGPSTDDMIIQLLHSKMSAIIGNDLVIAEISLKGDDSTLQYTFDCHDGKYMLPTTTEEYYSEGVTRDSIPWWMRNDGFSFEFVRPFDIVDISDEDLFKDIVDPMDEFEKIIVEAAESHIGMTKEPARIVQVEKWKPKKIE